MEITQKPEGIFLTIKIPQKEALASSGFDVDWFFSNQPDMRKILGVIVENQIQGLPCNNCSRMGCTMRYFIKEGSSCDEQIPYANIQ